MKNYRVGIIGGGASGIMAAVMAASFGAIVTVLEKKEKIGKKILVTGNGKCNLSNLSFSAREYYSDNPEKLPDYFSKFSVEDTVHFFEGNGMLLFNRGGYLYPRSGQAVTVLHTLEQLLASYKVRIVTECEIFSVEQNKRKDKEKFHVQSSQGDFFFDRLILSCGSPAGEKEFSMAGYQYAMHFGHTLLKPLPALVQLKGEGNFFKTWAGVRCEAKISLWKTNKQGMKLIQEEIGEIQLTDYGISGIPVFQLSRHVSRALEEKAKVKVIIDFLPEFSEKEWMTFVQTCQLHAEGKGFASCLEGILPGKLVSVFLKYVQVKPEDKIARQDKRLVKLLELIRAFPLVISATNPFQNAQVCAGGIPLSQVTQNLESNYTKGLYLTGEMLDVDGRCGGYNLQWAWTSGAIAGASAAGGNLFEEKEKIPIRSSLMENNGRDTRRRPGRTESTTPAAVKKKKKH